MTASCFTPESGGAGQKSSRTKPAPPANLIINDLFGVFVTMFFGNKCNIFSCWSEQISPDVTFSCKNIYSGMISWFQNICVCLKKANQCRCGWQTFHKQHSYCKQESIISLWMLSYRKSDQMFVQPVTPGDTHQILFLAVGRLGRSSCREGRRGGAAM